MKERLKGLLRPQGGFDIMVVGNEYYMIKFDLLANREKGIKGGLGL